MKRLFLVSFCVLTLLSVSFMTLSQEELQIACDDYIAKLETQLSTLNIRLEAFVKAPSSIRSDYYAWQERRLDWQAAKPPECALQIHDDVIAMYADLGDIYAWGLWLELDPTSISGNRLVLEAIDRALVSIESVTQLSVEISGNEITIEGVSDSLRNIADRFANG